MKSFLIVVSIVCIALNLDAAKKRLRDPLGSTIESTAHVRYRPDVVLTPEQKRVLVSCVAYRAYHWFKSPERFTSRSIRLNEMVVSNADNGLTGWFVKWKFQHRKKRVSNMWISRSDLDFAMKRQEKK